MLTHLVHFHIQGASSVGEAANAEYGWAQGHFLGGYLGAGAGAGAALDNFNAGWAQGSILAYYWGAGAGAAAEERSPWWSTWRDHTGWNEDAPSLAELVMAGQDRFIEAEPGVVVPAFIPDEAESEEILLEAWGEGGLASISKDVGVDAKGAKNVVRWIAREERKAIIEWRSRLIDDQNLIIMLAMLDD